MAEDLGRWLRRVRPDTAADQDWAAGPEGDQVLAAVHRVVAARTGQRAVKARRSRGARALRWTPSVVLALTAIVVVVVALAHGPNRAAPNAFVPPTQGSGSGAVVLPTVRPASFLLSPYTSCSSLLGSLRSHTATTVQSYGYLGDQYGYAQDFRSDAGLPAAGANTSSTSQKSADSADNPGDSSTNVQEVGVDEPDIVKVDGSELVTITDGILRVIDTATRAVTGTLDLTLYAGWQGAQLLVDGTHALVILSADATYAGPSIARNYRAAADPASSQSTYLFVDLSGRPTVTGQLRASGAYVDARMIGSTVRLVVQSSPAINLPPFDGSAKSKAATKKAVLAAPVSAWLPKYSVTTSGATVSHTVGCDQMSHAADFSGTSLLSIYTVDLTHLGADPTPVSVAADGDTVYANTSSLYIASNPDWYCCAQTTAKQVTQIHRFDIEGAGAPTYLGSGSVSGRLLNSYSLSDYAGYLRIATTTGEDGGSSSSSVDVLADDTLKLTGKVDGIGKGEQIYAVRFVGTSAYVITYQQTDPLYVVDLRIPAAPRVTGTLTMSGVSTYLYDAGDGHVVGVGQQLTDGEGSGVQLSLFDVTVPNAPKRSGLITVPNTGGELTPLDPHSFLFWQPSGLVVAPINTWTSSQSGQVLVARVSGNTLTKIGVLANPLPDSGTDDGLGIQRSLIVNGALWTVSGGGVQVSSQPSLARLTWIPFE